MKYVAMQRAGWRRVWEVSHFGFLFDFEELCHVGEIFLVGFSHLLLCSLRVHNLQALQTRADKHWEEDQTFLLTLLLNSWFVPEEEWKLRWSWFLRSDLWLWTFLHTSCSASATFSVENDRRYRALGIMKKKKIEVEREKWSALTFTCSDLEILALVASLTWACRTLPLPLFPSWPRLKPRSSW